MNQTTALILAGGLGTRLRSVINDRSKVMAQVLGRPFITFIFDQVIQAGVRDIVLCTGHFGEHARQALGTRYRDATLRYSQEPGPLGTAGALRLALDQVQTPRVLALNGDSLCPCPLEGLDVAGAAHHTPATVLLARVPDASRYGRVTLDAQGRVTGFLEKQPDPQPGLVNAGVYLIQSDPLRQIAPGRVVSLEREIFPQWAKDHALGGCQTDAPCWTSARLSPWHGQKIFYGNGRLLKAMRARGAGGCQKAAS
jgi:D-glycero-alpha-D-manno-heptose 1-phosphate guanylyltransferase